MGKPSTSFAISRESIVCRLHFIWEKRKRRNLLAAWMSKDCISLSTLILPTPIISAPTSLDPQLCSQPSPCHHGLIPSHPWKDPYDMVGFYRWALSNFPSSFLLPLSILAALQYENLDPERDHCTWTWRWPNLKIS